ncbi:transposase [Methylobacterium nonmethylotrophicum]|uniref:Transposase n=1 Tax=Methylobacterium nonmethylotrophicum TaxID=1141884 RepID=A0A4Z0NG26_9HYPH|nr:transposase [Methylobacterium nonmethylotrophicum]
MFWPSDTQWDVISPFLPASGANRSDDRRALSGIIQVSLSSCRWPDFPKEYGSPSTVYQRFRRWRHRSFWTRMLQALSQAGWTQEASALDPLALSQSRPVQKGQRIDRAWRPDRDRWLAERMTQMQQVNSTKTT